eukprot:TRINITY_DN67209_c5_g3_i1.p1 TRINITY_DN67209_c5_g3~~TRINITY_DN67209_c5_g3_i1.p1  ORF type:complete len:253 (+),score=25.20 TRINITY_DN67209_c5_g3_i1:58-759(+)
MPDTNHTTGTDTNTTKLGDETLGISLALKDSSTWLFQTRHARDGASEAMETIEEGAEITLKHSNTVLAKVSDAFVCDKYDCAMYNIDPSAVNVGAVANIPGAFQLADTDCYHFGKILSARGYVTSTAGESSLVHCRVWCNSSLENLIQGDLSGPVAGLRCLIFHVDQDVLTAFTNHGLPIPTRFPMQDGEGGAAGLLLGENTVLGVYRYVHGVCWGKQSPKDELSAGRCVDGG